MTHLAGGFLTQQAGIDLIVIAPEFPVVLTNRQSAARLGLDAHALPFGRRGQPGANPLGVAQPVDVFDEAKPHRLADIARVRVTQLVAASDGPNEILVGFDEPFPRLAITRCGAGDQNR